MFGSFGNESAARAFLEPTADAGPLSVGEAAVRGQRYYRVLSEVLPETRVRSSRPPVHPGCRHGS